MISLCLTTYERTDLLFESFAQVIDDDRISEIVIVDDCSSIQVYETIKEYVKDIPKVKLYRNEVNLDCYRNKKRSVELASNEWVIVFDSDNILTKEYVDAIFDLNPPFEDGSDSKSWCNWMIYQPSFSKPHFNFTEYQGNAYAKDNVRQYINDSTFQTMLNAMNYFVNRKRFLSVWDGSIDPVTSDSLYQNYRWLEAGNSIYVVPGLEYEHRVHDGSHYKNNVRRTPRGFHDSIIEKMKQW
jgi:glycosyltransferase involved in cell wall biosynthesis